MATCPNKNLDSWKNLVSARGENVAHALWDMYGGNVPESESRESIVKAGLKAINALQTDKAVTLFSTLDRNKVKGDVFWKKVQETLQIPKEQIELLKQYNTTNREELVTNMLADYSYTIEINTAKAYKDPESFLENYATIGNFDYSRNVSYQTGEYIYEKEDRSKSYLDSTHKTIITKEEFDKAINKANEAPNSSTYSNLTVPGGTNYTENEIATPAITPSIKGHAQFATDKGIGWFRSDDKAKKGETFGSQFSGYQRVSEGTVTDEADIDDLKEDLIDGKITPETFTELTGLTNVSISEDKTKTRRILEIQSELFQKGRDKEDLAKIPTGKVLDTLSESDKQKYFEIRRKDIDTWTKEEIKFYDEIDAKFEKIGDNKFLQLLNKDNNWVTFFVKSIIQDSAKKGYEKVLFPSGDTIGKIEGFDKVEEEIKEFNDKLEKIPKANTIQELKDIVISVGKSGGSLQTEKEWHIKKTKEELNHYLLAQKDTLSTIKFYEETVANILKKQGYSPKLITDEYGNTWNEITLNKQRDREKILFQLEEGPAPSKASPKTIKLLRDLLLRIGVNVAEYENIVIDGVKQNANGAALITQKLIQIVDGKEDVALPEEAMHFVVEIIQQKNPKLFKKLLSEINNYKTTLDGVFDAYGNHPLYKTADGSRDVIKLKKEAIAKVLAQVVINKMGRVSSEESNVNIARVEGWWNTILNFLRNLFSKSGFNELSKKIIRGEEIGTADDIVNGTDAYLQMDRQEYLYNTIKNTKNIVDKRDNGYWLDGKKIRRVTDIIKSWYERKFNEKDLTKTEFQKAVEVHVKDKGTDGHADFEKLFEVFIDENGYLRDEPLDDSEYVSKLDKENRDLYEILKENYRRRLLSIASKAKGGRTRFLVEVIVLDRKRQIGGTIDFMAIQPDGTVTILDWKFVKLNLEKTEDIPWYKIDAWRQQMDQYRYILQNEYGVKPKDFAETRMIPIYAKYTDADYKNEELPVLLSVEIGDVNIKNIEKDYLLPVGTLTEKTGNKKVDELIDRLNTMYKKMSEKKAVTEDEKIEKKEQLNTLFKAIRRLQMKGDLKPLLLQAKIFNRQIENIINEYEEKFKGKNPEIFTEKEINDYSKKLEDALDTIKKYVTLDRDLKSFFKDATSEEDKNLKDEVSEVSEIARDYESSLNDIQQDFVSEIIAGSEQMEKDYLSPEKVIKGITKWFSTTSTLQLRAIQLLFKKANKAFTYAEYDTQTENIRLQGIKERYDKWARSKGLTKKNYFSILVKSDKHELIDEYKKEFYSELKNKIKERDTDWVRDNIDAGKYIDFMKSKLEEEIQRIDNKPRFGTQEQIDKEIFIEKKDANAAYDTSTAQSVGWLRYDYAKQFPKREKWESERWKILNRPENAPAKEFYDYIRERNAEYRDLGYLSKRDSDRIFLPFAKSSTIEKLVMGRNTTIGEGFLRSISVDEGEIGYGNIDPETGKPIDTIPRYFIAEIEDPSMDLFRVMALYNTAAIKYKYVSNIEYIVRSVVNVERSKKSISTSMFGKTHYKNDILQENPDNSENSKLVEDMMKAIIYGQKYLQNETFDQLLFKLGSWGETLNKKLGVNVFPKNISERQVSINKSIDSLNNTFQLATLGFNLLSATSNRFGGSAQSIINSGKYFTKTDYIAAEARMFMNKLGGEDAKKILGALDYFLPLTENYGEEIANKLSVSKFNSQNLQQGLMYLMRKADSSVQTSNFIAYIQNTIVQDGALVNARVYVRSLPKYKDRNSGTREQRERLEEEYEKDVKALIDEKGVMKLGKLENGNFVIPGVDRKSKSVIDTRTIIQNITRDALGNLSPLELRLINLNIIGKSMMVFKNWIPRQIDVRFGNLKYNVASDAYEWGRMRTVYRVFSEKGGPFSIINGLDNLYNSLSGTDKGIKFLMELYESKKNDYEKDTGKELNMTRDEFIDLVRSNIRNQALDLIFLLTLFIMVASLKALVPDDDEDPAVKAQYRFVVKMADKLRDELYYFYDLTSISSLLGSGIFPSLSLIDNARKGFTNFFVENWALATGDDETVEKTKVIKYWMKTFPVTNQMAGYLPMFYPELAKDLGLKVQSNYGIR
jgi:hypothetical protein